MVFKTSLLVTISGFLKKVASKHLAIFTGTTLKLRLYDSKSLKTTRKRKNKEKKRAMRKKTRHTKNFYIEDFGVSF